MGDEKSLQQNKGLWTNGSARNKQKKLGSVCRLFANATHSADLPIFTRVYRKFQETISQQRDCFNFSFVLQKTFKNPVIFYERSSAPKRQSPIREWVVFGQKFRK